MRCAYCHDTLGDARHSCRGCRTLLHRDCAQQLEICPTLGCKRATRPSETPLRGGYSSPWSGPSLGRLVPTSRRRPEPSPAPDPEHLRRLHLGLWVAALACVFLQVVALGARDRVLSPEQAVHARWVEWSYVADWRYGGMASDRWGGSIQETEGGLLSGGPDGHLDGDYQAQSLLEFGPQGDDVFLHRDQGSVLAELIALFPFLRFAASFMWISTLLFLFRKRIQDCGRLQRILLLSAPTCWIAWWALQAQYLSVPVTLIPLALLTLGGAFLWPRQAGETQGRLQRDSPPSPSPRRSSSAPEGSSTQACPAPSPHAKKGGASGGTVPRQTCRI